VKNSHLKVVWAVVLIAVLFAIPVAAQEPAKKARPATESDESGRIFDIKVPKGFEPEPQEEPGIVKWKKDSAEIYLVVGDLFLESGEGLFQRLFTAASENKSFENVRKLNIKGGHGLVYTEKSPGEPGRLRSMHMIVITDKKVIQIDFSAPEKDFAAMAADFEAARKSFKLKNTSP
jgi:hypothetical protein